MVSGAFRGHLGSRSVQLCRGQGSHHEGPRWEDRRAEGNGQDLGRSDFWGRQARTDATPGTVGGDSVVERFRSASLPRKFGAGTALPTRGASRASSRGHCRSKSGGKQGVGHIFGVDLGNGRATSMHVAFARPKRFDEQPAIIDNFCRGKGGLGTRGPIHGSRVSWAVVSDDFFVRPVAGVRPHFSEGEPASTTAGLVAGTAFSRPEVGDEIFETRNALYNGAGRRFSTSSAAFFGTHKRETADEIFALGPRFRSTAPWRPQSVTMPLVKTKPERQQQKNSNKAQQKQMSRTQQKRSSRTQQKQSRTQQSEQSSTQQRRPNGTEHNEHSSTEKNRTSRAEQAKQNGTEQDQQSRTEQDQQSRTQRDQQSRTEQDQQQQNRTEQSRTERDQQSRTERNQQSRTEQDQQSRTEQNEHSSTEQRRTSTPERNEHSSTKQTRTSRTEQAQQRRTQQNANSSATQRRTNRTQHDQQNRTQRNEHVSTEQRRTNRTQRNRHKSTRQNRTSRTEQQQQSRTDHNEHTSTKQRRTNRTEQQQQNRAQQQHHSTTKHNKHSSTKQSRSSSRSRATATTATEQPIQQQRSTTAAQQHSQEDEQPQPTETTQHNRTQLNRSKLHRRFAAALGCHTQQCERNRLPSWKRDGRESSMMDLPLHAPKMAVCDGDQLYNDIMNDYTVLPHHKEALQYLRVDSLYPNQVFPISKWPKSSLSSTDFDQLLSNDIIERALVCNHGHFGYLFCTPEWEKLRRRVVHDVLSANVLCKDPWPLNFTPLNTLRSSVHKGQWGCTFDVKCMYYQFQLSPTVRSRFPIRDEHGDLFFFKRLPMGFKWSCNIAQVIMLFLTQSIASNAIHIEVYIDNVMFVGSHLQVHHARIDFLAICQKYSLILGEDSGLTRLPVFRGIQFDLHSKRTSLAGAFRGKFISRSASADGSWIDWRSLIGSATYAAMVLDYDLSHLYHLLKMHAIHQYDNSNKVICLWKEAQLQWDRVKLLIFHNTATQVLNPTISVTVVTDAATETSLGGSVIILSSGRIIVDQFHITGWHHNNDMEAQALYLTLQRNASLLSFRHIRYLGDNTAVLSCLGSSHSKGFFLNLQVGRILGRLRRISSTISLTYICSLCNPADAPSRGECMSSRHLRVIRHICNGRLPTARLRGVEVVRRC